jgi:1-acyl-sn-glycerol-3-phosphate acyltransferase
VLLILFAFPITLLLLLFPSSIQNKGMFLLLKLISNAWFILCGILPKNYHRDKVDFSKSYIITPNHQSYIDAASVYTTLPRVFKSLGKIEIEKTPIYGIIYKIVVITVDRSSATAKAASFRKLKKEIERGLSLVIFSEGTFPNEPQLELMPFQSGGYALAKMQATDILPVLYLDAINRMHPLKVWNASPGLSRAVFLPPLSFTQFEKITTNELRDYAQNYMQACLDFCRRENVFDVWQFALNWQLKNTFQP